MLTADDVAALAALVRGTPIALISDEVYEHMVYDGARHESLARNDELASRTVVIGSFGKTFHATGWKVGYALAPRAITAEIRRIHQFNVFTVNSPMQHGLAAFLADPSRYERCRRSSRRSATACARRSPTRRSTSCPARAATSSSRRYARVSDAPAPEFAEWLVREHGVATIPLTAFYRDRTDHRIIRFCFAKRDETINAAAERLRRLR